VLRSRERDFGFEPITSGGERIAPIVAPLGNRGRALNRQRYARHPAGLDHRRRSPIHWAADTHGDKSEGATPKPGRPQRVFSANPQPRRVSSLRQPNRVSAASALSGFDFQRLSTNDTKKLKTRSPRLAPRLRASRPGPLPHSRRPLAPLRVQVCLRVHVRLARPRTCGGHATVTLLC
jgi:hypothetical protein